MTVTRVASLLVIAAALWPGAAAAQVPQPVEKRVSLFNGRDLTGWKPEHAKARVRDGAIRVEPSRAWVRTREPYGDFILMFDMRVTPSGGKAGLYVRGLPVFDKDDRPANAFRITRTFPRSAEAETAWERWEVECVGQTLQLRVDGVVVYSIDTVKVSHGYLGFWTDTTAEFRAVEIRRLAPQPPADIAEWETPGTPGVVMPSVVKEVKPSYTPVAVQQRIEGVVWIRAIVDATGSISWLSIERSLDPFYGLDASALAAAKQWRFRPATKDGTPVAVLITIALTFTLK
jgi:TonB family protein